MGLNQDKVQFFCDESGTNPDARYIAIGLLVTKQSNRPLLLEQMRAVREVHNFYNELHFEKMSSLRYKIYRDIYAATFPLVRYRAGILNRADLNPEKFQGKQYILLNVFTRRVVARFSHEGVNALLYLDFKNREKKDNGLTYLLNETNLSRPDTLKAVEVLDSKRSELMQLSDLYLGAIRFGYEIGCPLKDRSIFSRQCCSRKESLYKEFRTLHAQHGTRRSIQIWEWQQRKRNRTLA